MRFWLADLAGSELVGKSDLMAILVLGPVEDVSKHAALVCGGITSLGMFFLHAPLKLLARDCGTQDLG